MNDEFKLTTGRGEGEEGMTCVNCGVSLWDKPGRANDDNLCSPECYTESLEAKCAWQEEMLERAKDSVYFAARRDVDQRHEQWLSDLEKGPTK